MTTISLSATDTLLDLMAGRAEPRKAPFAGTLPDAASARPLRVRLLPRSWREALDRRARQRELEMAFDRLAETSPHLLADVGMKAAQVAPGTPASTWTRTLPPAVVQPSSPTTMSLGMARSRRRLAELEDHLLKDIGITRAQAQHEARRPSWDAPHAWLR